MNADRTLEEICIWHKIMTDPESTTAKDVTDEKHPLYKCKVCTDPYTVNNACKYYKGETLLKVKYADRQILPIVL